MKSFIIGTAGHIDHGKTELIRALTGVDTDRLKEEKERGISIELGFADIALPGGVAAGVVDVPGHEHFVKNMLAGASGFDLVLLAVAADDGVMPQTLEHLAIVDLLGVKHGVLVITKADLVDEDMLELAREDVAEAVAGTALEGAEVVVTSSRTGRGLDELREALLRVASTLGRRDESGPFRLPVDRVFTLKGIGTVVTGTMWEGSAADGDEGVIQPSGRKVRVRNIQVHGGDVERAFAGQRVAMNLPGVSTADIERGDVLGTPGYLRTTFMADAGLQLIAAAPRPLKNRARVRLHHGTREVMARVVLLGGREELPPGEKAYVQFRLESPLIAAYGDRFILRSYSPVTTIGGGVILDAHPAKHRHHRREVLEGLEVRERGMPRELLLLAVEEKGVPLSRRELISRVELGESEVDSALAELISGGKMAEVAGDGAPLFVTPALLASLRERLTAATVEMHEANPLKPGVEKEALRRGADAALTPEVFEALLRDLVSAGALEVEAGRVRLAGKGRSLSTAEQAVKEELLGSIREGGYSPPLFKEMLASSGLERGALRDMLAMLVEEGEIEQVNADYFLAHGLLSQAEERIRAHLAASGRLEVAEVRDMLGASRKYAIPLLEHFDRKRVTRREGDYRMPF